MKTDAIKGHYGTVTCHITQECENMWSLALVEPSHARRGRDDTGRTIFIDPSGGPFIGLGSRLIDFNVGLPSLKIEHIGNVKGEILLVTEPPAGKEEA